MKLEYLVLQVLQVPLVRQVLPVLLLLLSNILYLKYREKKAEKKSPGWIGGLLKSAVTMIMEKDNYEDMLESTKSMLTIKHPEFAKHNICALSQSDELVLFHRFIKVGLRIY